MQAYAKCKKCMGFTSEHCLRVVVSTESLGTPEGSRSNPRLKVLRGTCGRWDFSKSSLVATTLIPRERCISKRNLPVLLLPFARLLRCSLSAHSVLTQCSLQCSLSADSITPPPPNTFDSKRTIFWPTEGVKTTAIAKVFAPPTPPLESFSYDHFPLAPRGLIL